MISKYYAYSIKGIVTLFFTCFFFLCVKSQTPGAISTGLTVWLKANSGTSISGANLTGWTDQSAAATSVIVNGSPDYVSNGYNFNPYINFTVSSGNGGDFLRIPNTNLRSFFWVAKLDNLSREATHLATYDDVTNGQPCNGCPIHGGNNGGAVAQYHEFGYGTGQFQTAGVWRKNGTSSGITYNSPHSGNFDIVTALGQAVVPTNVFMGGQSSSFSFDGRERDWLGPVAEIIAYNGAITPAEANKIESYLAIKYGITLGGAGSTTLYYTAPNGTTIWGMNTGYHNQVAGIGNDMILEGLDQPKSHSIHTAYDAVTMANNNFTMPVSMANGEYLVWGRNTGNFAYTCQNFIHNGPATTISAMYNRVWRTQKTNSPTGNVIIEIDMAMLQGPTGIGTAVNADIRLMIDNNTAFNDGSAGEHTYSPDAGYTATGGKIYFTVPYSDIQSGEGFFRLGMASPVPIADAGPDVTMCSGDSQVIGSNPVTGCTYSWNPASGLSSATSSNPSVTLTNATASPVTTNYTVTTTVPATGCTATDQVAITVNSGATADANIDQDVCVGGTINLNGLIGGSASSGTWTAPSGTFSDPSSLTSTYTPTITSGSVTLTLTTDDPPGLSCAAASDQMTVTIIDLPTVTVSSITICTGQSGIITATPGTPATYSYVWTVPAGVVNPGNVASFSASEGGTYSVLITNTNTGCQSTSASGTVTLTILPTAVISGTTTVCEGSASPLITITGSDGTEPYTFTYNINGTPNQTINSTGASATISVPTSIPGTYNFNLVSVQESSSTACSQAQSGTATIIVSPTPVVFAGNDITVCEGQGVSLTGSGANTYSWDNGVSNGVSFTPAIGSLTYTVTGTTADGCVGTDQVIVNVNPAPNADFAADTTSGCEPLVVNFTNAMANAANCNWIISDGTSLSGCGTVSKTFEEPGCYTVTLTTTDVSGCTATHTETNIVCVYPNPVASFGMSNTGIPEFATHVQFFNSSTNAVDYIWDFGDGSGSFDEDPAHEFAGLQSGADTVSLIAISQYGCVDTAYRILPYEEQLIYYVPNSFTPDGDEYNNVFQPIFTSGHDPYNYSLLIFNRWGEIIFESHDAGKGWDGTYAGELTPSGIYTWKILFKMKNEDDRKEVSGHVNLIR